MKYLIKNFEPQGGKHCITTSLKQVFAFNNYKISEEMLFGIGKGLSFVYLNMSSSPMISGRIKPKIFEENISKSLNIDINISQPKNYKVADNKLKKEIMNDNIVMIYVDMPFLSYLKLDKDSHFGGHSIVVFGFDDEKKVYYISDRDSLSNPMKSKNGIVGKDYHLVPYMEMKAARESNFRPFPANNKWAKFDFTNCFEITSGIIEKSIIENSREYLYTGANLLGVNGINKFSKEILKWNKFSKSKLILSCITNFFMINQAGGTGGGAFRNMYGEFLIEADSIIKNGKYEKIGEEYLRISESWDDIADMLWELQVNQKISLLDKLSDDINKIYLKERDLQNKIVEK